MFSKIYNGAFRETPAELMAKLGMVSAVFKLRVLFREHIWHFFDELKRLKRIFLCLWPSTTINFNK